MAKPLWIVDMSALKGEIGIYSEFTHHTHFLNADNFETAQRDSLDHCFEIYPTGKRFHDHHVYVALVPDPCDSAEIAIEESEHD